MRPRRPQELTSVDDETPRSCSAANSILEKRLPCITPSSETWFSFPHQPPLVQDERPWPSLLPTLVHWRPLRAYSAYEQCKYWDSMRCSFGNSLSVNRDFAMHQRGICNTARAALQDGGRVFAEQQRALHCIRLHGRVFPVRCKRHTKS